MQIAEKNRKTFKLKPEKSDLLQKVRLTFQGADQGDE
jgi:hypothetical protein